MCVGGAAKGEGNEKKGGKERKEKDMASEQKQKDEMCMCVSIYMCVSVSMCVCVCVSIGRQGKRAEKDGKQEINREDRVRI